MDKATRFARLEDRVRGNLYDLTDAADWPSTYDILDLFVGPGEGSDQAIEFEEMLDDYRRDVVKAAMAEIVAQLSGTDAGWTEILAGVLDEDTDPIVTQLECDNALEDHDDVMLYEHADPYNPREHAGYVVRFRADEMDDMMLPIRDGLARKLDVGCATIKVEQVEGGHETCPLVSITLPLSDARELAR